jgi:hypothetical protein
MVAATRTAITEAWEGGRRCPLGRRGRGSTHGRKEMLTGTLKGSVPAASAGACSSLSSDRHAAAGPRQVIASRLDLVKPASNSHTYAIYTYLALDFSDSLPRRSGHERDRCSFLLPACRRYRPTPFYTCPLTRMLTGSIERTNHQSALNNPSNLLTCHYWAVGQPPVSRYSLAYYLLSSLALSTLTTQSSD